MGALQGVVTEVRGGGVRAMGLYGEEESCGRDGGQGKIERRRERCLNTAGAAPPTPESGPRAPCHAPVISLPPSLPSSLPSASIVSAHPQHPSNAPLASTETFRTHQDLILSLQLLPQGCSRELKRGADEGREGDGEGYEDALEGRRGCR